MRYELLEDKECRQRHPQLCYFLLLSAIFLFSTAALFISSSWAVQPIQDYICSSSFTADVEFRSASEYRDLSPVGDQAWEDLLTSNGGFLVQEIDGKEHTYGISMFHQVHCLQKIRLSLQALSNSSVSHENHLDGHIVHCLDYLRQVSFSIRFDRTHHTQSILCHADDTIESPVIGEDEEHVDGYVKHKCRNNEPLYQLSRDSGAGMEDTQFYGADNGTNSLN